MVVLFLADGFETVEALCPADILRRGGVDVKTVSISKSRYVKSSHGITVEADMTAEELGPFEKNKSGLEAVILPGGMPGAKNLDESGTVDAYVNGAYRLASEGAKVFLCAICAAPFILGKRGILEGREAVCYPGFEIFLKGAVIKDAPVVRDGFTICSKAMGCAHEFGFGILSALRGEKAAADVRSSVYYG